MLSKAVAVLKEKSNFLITTHASPDGDAVGSVSALATAIKSIGKKATLCLKDRIPQEFSFLPEMKTVTHNIPAEHFDAVFVLDCAGINRVGDEFVNFKRYDTLINIDHHKSNDHFGDINIVDGKACSTGILVYNFIKSAGIAIGYETAIGIYTTILVDTGSFRYGSASADAFRVAAEMIDKGVNAWDVAEKVYETQPISRINLLRLALNQLEAYVEKGFASITITKKMLKEANADFDVTDGFINFPRSIQGVEVALLFKEIDANKYKLSLRSKGSADVCAIAEKFGGGGHKNAAGCFLSGNINEIKAKVFSYLESYLKSLPR